MMNGELSDPKAMFALLLQDAPLNEMSDMAVMIVRGIADRVESEFPDEASKLKEAALIVEGAVKAVISNV